MDIARARIMKAYSQGLFDTYGPRRHVEVEKEVDQPGPTIWKADEKWTDPQGINRVGRFVRLPGKKVMQKFSVPRGVVASEVVEHAGAIVGAFLETLAIVEEAATDRKAPKEVASVVSEMIKRANG